jgi:hypothetical protein
LIRVRPELPQSLEGSVQFFKIFQARVGNFRRLLRPKLQATGDGGAIGESLFVR